jgi:hypothetical protein
LHWWSLGNIINCAEFRLGQSRGLGSGGIQSLGVSTGKRSRSNTVLSATALARDTRFLPSNGLIENYYRTFELLYNRPDTLQSVHLIWTSVCVHMTSPRLIWNKPNAIGRQLISVQGWYDVSANHVWPVSALSVCYGYFSSIKLIPALELHSYDTQAYCVQNIRNTKLFSNFEKEIMLITF